MSGPCANCCTGRGPCMGGCCPNAPVRQPPDAEFDLEYVVELRAWLRIRSGTAQAAREELERLDLRTLARRAWQQGQRRLVPGRVVPARKPAR